MRTNLLAAALIGLLVLLGAAASPVLGGEQPSSASAAVKADLDGNKIFDDLEARLEGMTPSDRLSAIVVLDLPASNSRLAALRAAAGAFGISHRFSIVDGFAASLSKAQIQALARLGLVRHIEENSVVHASNDSAQNSFGVTKARIDAPGLDGDGDGNAASYSPGDYVAAVIDTGIDTGHADLDGGKVLAFVNCNGTGPCTSTAPFDDNGHGTHVAATIAGTGEGRADLLYKGVAPAGALVGVKVLDGAGSGSMADVTEGIDWVVANKATYGIEAINLSLGTTGCSNGASATEVAVNNAAASGIAVFVAAGNSGPATCTIGSPGAAANGITVAAMADLGMNGFYLASFSSRGSTTGPIKPDVAAPGVGVTSAQSGTTTGYVAFNGTSMATPFTAGVALLMLDANPALSPAQIKSTLKSTAQDWGRGGNSSTAGTSGSDIEYGAGRLDAYAALDAAGAPLGTQPAAPTHEFREGSLSSGAQIDYPIAVTTTQFPIAATLITPSAGGFCFLGGVNFNLSLLSPSGTTVASTSTSLRQDQFGYLPTATGTHTLRVRSSCGSGGFFLDYSAGTSGGGSPPAPPPPPPPPPGGSVEKFPSSTVLLTGSQSGGSAASLGSNDNVYFQVTSNSALFPSNSSWYGVFTGVSNALSNLKVTYSGLNSSTCSQSISIWRWTTSTWVTLQSASVGVAEVLIADLAPSGAAGDYVSGTSGDGEVRVRVACSAFFATWTSRGDLMKIAYDAP